MGLLEVVHEDNTSLDNFHFDFLQLVRFAIGLAVTPNEVGANAFNADLDLFIHIEEIEPPDADIPLGAVVFWMSALGMGANRQLKIKFKDAGGTVRSANIAILTP